MRNIRYSFINNLLASFLISYGHPLPYYFIKGGRNTIWLAGKLYLRYILTLSISS